MGSEMDDEGYGVRSEPSGAFSGEHRARSLHEASGSEEGDGERAPRCDPEPLGSGAQHGRGSSSIRLDASSGRRDTASACDQTHTDDPAELEGGTPQGYDESWGIQRPRTSIPLIAFLRQGRHGQDGVTGLSVDCHGAEPSTWSDSDSGSDSGSDSSS